MSKFRGKRLRTVAVVAGVGLVVAATTAALSEQPDEVKVSALFADASPLVAGNDVKASGVNVGTIDAITVQDGLARVDMTLSGEVLPLHKDATATTVDKDLLGERFIELDTGTASAPEMDSPAVIPESQTDRAVDLQSVLNTVDPPTGEALAAMVTTLGEGTGARGEQIAGAIAALQPAMQQTDELAAILSDQNELLTQLIDSAQPVASSVAADRGANLDRLVGSTTTTLSTVAENRQQVRATLDRLPATLTSARQTLAQVAGVADPTADTLASLRPVTDDLTDISTELQRFADASDPALASLPPVLERANVMLDEAAPLVRSLQPAGQDLRGVTESLRTLSETALSTRLVDLMEFMKGWSLATSDYDAISHYFKAVTPYSPKALGQTAAGPVPGLPHEPVPNLPLPEGGRTPLPGKPGAPPEEASPLPTLPDGGVTGLTQKQESNMVDQLLGGGL